ncbi:ABC transporter substrate-binding protein [Paenibacillus piri]|uniref:ABC transporter substrate-binding protein n=1 Tax=Paenibacillus piri TaxID=2547395 RepID=UPI0014053DEB|nr:ABC transporter substrate-binding protein [Paenibacillus piri]
MKLKAMTKFKVGSAALSTQDITVVFVGIRNGIYKKYNLDVDVKGVEGGVVALRGLQAGDFDVTFGLPENVISGVAQGADMKIIGATAAESLFSVFVGKDIQKIEDLKGKKAAVLQPNNGTDIQMRWWLKKHGLEPDKDVTIVSAGATPARFAALKTGQVAVVPLVPPVDIEAENLGYKRIANIRDDIPGINHDVISTTGKMIREKPEVLRAFIAATSEAIKFVKDPANFDEAVKVGVEELGFGLEITKRGLADVLPTIPDGAKFNKKGIEWSIQTAQEVGVLEKNFTIDKVIDESFYSK